MNWNESQDVKLFLTSETLNSIIIWEENVGSVDVVTCNIEVQLGQFDEGNKCLATCNYGPHQT